MNEIMKIVVVAVLLLVSASIVVGWISRTTVYHDNVDQHRMEVCQQSGGTWGDCYNTVIRYQPAK